MFSNCRGLGDLAKHLFFVDCIRNHNLDFLAVSEIGRRDFIQSFLNRLSGGADFVGHSWLPRGHSGGILVGSFIPFNKVASHINHSLVSLFNDAVLLR
jgi:hypothetical protein